MNIGQPLPLTSDKAILNQLVTVEKMNNRRGEEIEKLHLIRRYFL